MTDQPHAYKRWRSLAVFLTFLGVLWIFAQVLELLLGTGANADPIGFWLVIAGLFADAKSSEFKK